MKTSELTGHALNWAVAKCEGLCEGDFAWYYDRRDTFKYSIDWAQGGPIIEREKITPEWTGENWMAYIKHDDEFYGSRPLIAAMRCYVGSKLGNDVDVPEGL